MPVHTLSFPTESGRALEEVLEQKGFAFRALQHGYWQAHGRGVVLSFYTSGKMVIQGTEDAISQVLAVVGQWMSEAVSQLGCDESGKGDAFGPLVVAAVGVEAKDFSRLRLQGIGESKKATAAQIERWYRQIMALCRVETLVWEPAEFNQLYAEHANMNDMLTIGYENLLRRFSVGWDQVIVDAYVQNNRTRKLLASVAPGAFSLEVRGERHIAVGAASIVARRLFLEWFERQSIRLPLGSSAEARRVFAEVRASQPEQFSRYAKVNFFSQS